ncbi:MAG: hypothetical protein K6G54_03675 [Oscillospiraceae bacterium]|nr:hypothetical protein [Oscillospiraceae bacterium]
MFTVVSVISHIYLFPFALHQLLRVCQMRTKQPDDFGVIVTFGDGLVNSLCPFSLCTVLVIAHRMRTVEAADKIVVLSDGKVAEEGSPSELFTKENRLFRYMTQLQSASAGWSI